MVYIWAWNSAKLHFYFYFYFKKYICFFSVFFVFLFFCTFIAKAEPDRYHESAANLVFTQAFLLLLLLLLLVAIIFSFCLTWVPFHGWSAHGRKEAMEVCNRGVCVCVCWGNWSKLFWTRIECQTFFFFFFPSFFFPLLPMGDAHGGK